MTDRFVIDVVSDVICPWCFLGKRRLDRALSLLDGLEPLIRWRPFMLDPTIPPGGMDRAEYLTNKFGPERLTSLHDPLIEAGAELGVPFNFAAVTRTPNTLDAHRLLRWAQTIELQHNMAERLFMAYWNEGLDIGDQAVLAKCAGDVGINAAQIAELLAGEQDVDNVKAEIQHAGSIGVTGVPTYILAQSYALVGAQSPEVLADAIGRVAKEMA